MFHFNFIEICVHLLPYNDLIKDILFFNLIVSGLRRLESINNISIKSILLRRMFGIYFSKSSFLHWKDLSSLASIWSRLLIFTFFPFTKRCMISYFYCSVSQFLNQLQRVLSFFLNASLTQVEFSIIIIFLIWTIFFILF